MAANIVGAFEPLTQNVVKNAKVLLIGAGGIGCEVLKNLVLMGFGELEVIDLDTIEVSNLNRQFLFNKDSVGKPKSHIAKESVLRFNPNVNINSHYGDIMDKKYGTAFFNKFKLVINALDNKKARSHVNRMCLSCDIPLIESGTMGYSGQVEFIKKGFSLCYECFPKAEPKEYPMCTIRNTPKETIHCIIWSKYLFGQIFGENDEIVSMDERETDSGNISARDWAKIHNYDGQKLFKKIFYDDIDVLLNMPDLYASKIIKPVKLDSIYLTVYKSEYSTEQENKVLTLSQYISMFVDSVAAIKIKFINSDGCLIWDKDDDDFMNFVVSCTNIRSKIFNIDLKSHFDIKSMAGNIIPAIPTANAIIGGQIVIHALRVLRGKFSQCQTVFLRTLPNHRGELLVKDRVVQKPNPKCLTCSTEGVLYLFVDLYNFTVRQFEDIILRQKLNIIAPDVMDDSGRVIISSDEEDEVDIYSKTFFQADIMHGAKLTVDDYLQSYKVYIVIQHKIPCEEDPIFEIVGDMDNGNDTGNIVASEELNDDCQFEENKPIKIISVQSLANTEDDLGDVEAEAEQSKSSDETDMEKGIESGTVGSENGNSELSINEENSDTENLDASNEAEAATSDIEIDEVGAAQSDNEIDEVGAAQSDNEIDEVGASQSDNEIEAVGAVQSENEIDEVGAVKSANIDIEEVGVAKSDNEIDEVGAVKSDNIDIEEGGVAKSDNEMDEVGAVKSDNNEIQKDDHKEELLALKRKAEDVEVSDAKKSRQSTGE